MPFSMQLATKIRQSRMLLCRFGPITEPDCSRLPSSVPLAQRLCPPRISYKLRPPMRRIFVPERYTRLLTAFAVSCATSIAYTAKTKKFLKSPYSKAGHGRLSRYTIRSSIASALGKKPSTKSQGAMRSPYAHPPYHPKYDYLFLLGRGRPDAASAASTFKISYMEVDPCRKKSMSIPMPCLNCSMP